MHSTTISPSFLSSIAPLLPSLCPLRLLAALLSCDKKRSANGMFQMQATLLKQHLLVVVYLVVLPIMCRGGPELSACMYPSSSFTLCSAVVPVSVSVESLRDSSMLSDYISVQSVSLPLVLRWYPPDPLAPRCSARAPAALPREQRQQANCAVHRRRHSHWIVRVDSERGKRALFFLLLLATCASRSVHLCH